MGLGNNEQNHELLSSINGGLTPNALILVTSLFCV